MNIINSAQFPKRDKTALTAFIDACRFAALKDDHFKIASISIEVSHIDPLAVLDSIYDKNEFHFYWEHPATEEAVAGAEAIWLAEAEGSDRFKSIRDESKSVLNHVIAIGDLEKPFAGPHFFCGFTFFDNVREDSRFPASRVFIPRWQVSSCGGQYSAVANTRIDKDSDVNFIVEKIWAAHTKFSRFNYGSSSSNSVIEGDSRALVEIEDFEDSTDDFKNSVKKAIQRIEDGRYDKIVLSRRVKIRSQGGLHPLDSLNRLRNRFPACYSFSLGNGHGQSFIGATPEKLVRTDFGRLRTDAVAGSMRRGKTIQEDAACAGALINSEKDQREHRHVVDSILRRLYSIDIVAGPIVPPHLLTLSNVYHLRTPIEASLGKEKHILDVVGEMHPTPAVGGTPREAALADIYELERYERELYGGVVGWFNHRGDGEMVVGIRSATIESGLAELYAGAGIVKGSEPEKEKQETDIKFQALLNALR